MTGIVLSGGESRRMGTDKAFLALAGVPMIEHVVGILRGITGKVIIVTNSPDAYASTGVSVVADALRERGPLTGIYSGLLRSTDEYNFVVACDMPFLSPGLIAFMAGLAPGHDIVVPSVGDFAEPLHAIYSRRLLPVIEDRIRQGSRRIQGIFSEAKVRYVTEEEIDRYDPLKRSFKNLNTPDEYREAACLD